MKVLVIEDDPEVGETISMVFSMRWPDAQVTVKETGKEGVAANRCDTFDLAVLDVNLPDIDGFEVLGKIRETSAIPVIMLTVRATETDRVRGLEMGADDYLAKPFSPFELLARASAVLRRIGAGARTSEPRILQAGQIRIDADAAEVYVDDRPVNLTPTEFKILAMLVENADKVVTRDALIDEVWDMNASSTDAYLVKLHIQHLRKKLGDSGVDPKVIITVRGFGYKVPS